MLSILKKIVNNKKTNNKKAIKSIILFILFLDILSFGILIPMLPELKLVYNVNNLYVSLGLIVYELCAFFAAPILGQLSDKYGRKKILFICILGNIISWLVLVLSQSFLLFIIARIITGLTGGNISIVKSIGIDISESARDRKKFFSYFGALFGLAFVIGPFFGGILIQYGYQAPFLLALILNVISMFLLTFYLPETRKKNENTQLFKITYNTFSKIWEVFKLKKTRSLLFSTIFLFLGYFTYQGVISLFLDNSFNMDATKIGYILSGIGIFTAINQFFLIDKFWLKYFSDKKITTITFILLILLSIILSYFVHVEGIVIIGLFLISFFYTTLPPVFSTELIENYDKNKIGEINGVLDSLLTLMIVIALAISSISIDHNLNIFLFSLIFFIISAGFSFLFFKKNSLNK